MLFMRRDAVGFGERVRLMVWPRRSFGRSARYFMKRALRLQASPHAIAAGVATGVLCSFTPFIGLHFFIAIALAWLLRVNLVAAAIGTAFGNPVTLPVIWGSSLQVGKIILDHEGDSSINSQELGGMLLDMEFSKLWQPILEPMLVGALPLGLATAGIAYFSTLYFVRRFHEKRRRVLAERAYERNRQNLADQTVEKR